jgi:hypothetical protein
MTFHDAVILELVKAGLALLLVLVGWFVGQRILTSWEYRKKQQELNVLTARQFHDLIGEFKEIWRLWKMATYPGEDAFTALRGDEQRADLLRRATAAEGKVEAILLKLAVERELTGEEQRTLGLFRQSYQQLREAVRDNKPMLWKYRGPEYTLSHRLACQVALLIDRPPGWFDWRGQLPAETAIDNMAKVVAVRSADWEKEVEELGGAPDRRPAPVPANSPPTGPRVDPPGQ